MAKPRHNDLLPGPIRGISRTSLWKSWKAVRRDLKYSSIRDIVDFLDFDVNPDIWIDRLLRRIASGQYVPETPRRFTLGKSKGLSRTMTLSAIPDLVLYRTIVDFVYASSRHRSHKNVYFLRDELSEAQRRALSQGRERTQQAKDFETVEGQYSFTGRKSFYNWLRFAQYRKHLILEEAHDFIVVADISNFFDTILHSHVARAVQGLSVPPRMIGLLFFLLENLSIRQDYASSHGISLPTDEFDCSRTLAHIVLFPHDDAIVRHVGEANYVRWMDDQVIAATSKAEGLRILQVVGQSLARLHLTPNGQKSKILPLEGARRHYHLDLNQMLDDAEELSLKIDSSKAARRQFVSKVKGIWRKAKRHEGVGEFGKIIKRLYRLASLAGLEIFRSRAETDILADPSLVERVADYYRRTGTVGEYLDFIDSLMNNLEQVYPDVNVALTESLLRLEPIDRGDITRLQNLAKSLVRRDRAIPGNEDSAAIAMLLALRFGGRGIKKLLKNCLEGDRRQARPGIVRAAAIVYASRDSAAYQEVRHVASALLRNHLSSVVHLIAEISNYQKVPDRYRNRLRLSFDSVARAPYLDMRVLLTARLLLLSENREVRQWVGEWKGRTLRRPISEYDRRLLRRLVAGA